MDFYKKTSFREKIMKVQNSEQGLSTPKRSRLVISHSVTTEKEVTKIVRMTIRGIYSMWRIFLLRVSCRNSRTIYRQESLQREVDREVISTWILIFWHLKPYQRYRSRVPTTWPCTPYSIKTEHGVWSREIDSFRNGLCLSLITSGVFTESSPLGQDYLYQEGHLG